jgi:hypothetical protein
MPLLSESEVVSQVKVRVRDKLPQVDPQAVDEAVAVSLGAYADCNVRNFVPILVEREALARLSVRRPEGTA